MIARQCEGMESCLTQGCQVVRIGAGCRYIAIEFDTPSRMGHFQMTHRQIDAMQPRRDTAQPILRTRLVEHDITGKSKVQKVHGQLNNTTIIKML